MTQTQSLYVGAARMELGYPEGFFPHKGFRGRYFTGTHDALHVRTIYIKSNSPALLISLELGDIGDQWCGDIAASTGVPKENIFLTASHTHSAPHVHATIREDVIDAEMDEKFAAMCHDTVIACARAAVDAACEAKMDFISGECDLNCNRDYRCTGPKAPSAPYIQAPNPHGPSDKQLDIVRFAAAADGRDIAYLVNYPIHSIVTFYQTWTYEDSMLVSSDLTGNAMTYVEQRCDEGAVAMFMMAAAGDQIPRYTGNHRTFGRDGEVGWEYYGREASFSLNDAQSAMFGMEILHLIGQMDKGGAVQELSVTHCTIHPMGKVEGWNTEEHSFTETVKADGNSYAAQYKESAVPDFQYTPTTPMAVTLGMLRLGGLNLVFIPAELVCSIGAAIKAAVREHLDGSTMVVTQCNGAFSYIVDDESYREMTFEAIASHFMPGAAGAVVEGVRTMAKALCSGGARDDE